MPPLQKALNEQISNMSRMLVRGLLNEKLVASGASVNEATLDRLTTDLFEGSDEILEFDGEGPTDLSIEFTAEDLDELRRRSSEIVGNMPALIESMGEKVASSILKSLKAEWPEEDLRLQFETDEFRQRLEERWGKALDLLRMILALSHQAGQDFAVRSRRWKTRPHFAEVLIRLHMRACQVSREIITLLENGLSDGAMARWRTLHEIAVVATLIADAGEDIAERYLEHEAVESHEAMQTYLSTRLPSDPRPKQSEIKSVAREYGRVTKRYGTRFQAHYGWAAKHLGKPVDSFKDLEKAVGKTSLRSYYKLASFNVHAGVKGVSFRLGLLDHETHIGLAGASDAGLDEAGRHTAYTLTQISNLFPHRRSLDHIVNMKIMLKLRDQCCRAFARADRLLCEEAKHTPRQVRQ